MRRARSECENRIDGQPYIAFEDLKVILNFRFRFVTYIIGLIMLMPILFKLYRFSDSGYKHMGYFNSVTLSNKKMLFLFIYFFSFFQPRYRRKFSVILQLTLKPCLGSSKSEITLLKINVKCHRHRANIGVEQNP